MRSVRGRSLSMLSEQTLRALHLLARSCPGPVIEIGAYIGGSTLVLLDATKADNRLLVTIEEPVEHPTHPDLPTNNSVVDLRKNISSFGLTRDSHRIIAGTSFETWVLGELHHALVGKRAGLLAWDADACIDRDLVYLSPFLSPGSLVMIDDYFMGEKKGWRITHTVNKFTEMGVLEPIAYLPWATWFGRLLRIPTAEEVADLQAEWADLARRGDPYYERLMDYRERLDGGGPSPETTFAERMAFWRRAANWDGELR